MHLLVHAPEVDQHLLIVHRSPFAVTLIPFVHNALVGGLQVVEVHEIILAHEPPVVIQSHDHNVQVILLPFVVGHLVPAQAKHALLIRHRFVDVRWQPVPAEGTAEVTEVGVQGLCLDQEHPFQSRAGHPPELDSRDSLAVLRDVHVVPEDVLPCSGVVQPNPCPLQGLKRLLPVLGLVDVHHETDLLDVGVELVQFKLHRLLCVPMAALDILQQADGFGGVARIAVVDEILLAVQPAVPVGGKHQQVQVVTRPHNILPTAGDSKDIRPRTGVRDVQPVTPHQGPHLLLRQPGPVPQRRTQRSEAAPHPEAGEMEGGELAILLAA
mmetsp:Transcript_136803/g.237630  ORF Transcript_136803/g.237630 Transcript_136803/m.237630 type:complete len:325 (-) Transcript_136803:1123-2097(-)